VAAAEVAVVVVKAVQTEGLTGWVWVEAAAEVVKGAVVSASAGERARARTR
jgi:hypothetical protein